MNKVVNLLLCSIFVYGFPTKNKLSINHNAQPDSYYNPYYYGNSGNSADAENNVHSESRLPPWLTKPTYKSNEFNAGVAIDLPWKKITENIKQDNQALPPFVQTIQPSVLQQERSESFADRVCKVLKDKSKGDEQIAEFEAKFYLPPWLNHHQKKVAQNINQHQETRNSEESYSKEASKQGLEKAKPKPRTLLPFPPTIPLITSKPEKAEKHVFKASQSSTEPIKPNHISKLHTLQLHPQQQNAQQSFEDLPLRAQVDTGSTDKASETNKDPEWKCFRC